MISRVKKWAKKMKKELFILYSASKDKDVPWYAKALILIVIAYALSPIDLIPDFIPVIGYLDDLILLPLGIYLAVKLIPEEVLNKHREQASVDFGDKKVSRIGAILVMVIWAVLLYLAWHFFSSPGSSPPPVGGF